MLRLLLAGALLLTGCRERIVHNLTEAEANRILAKLYGIQANPEKVPQPDGRWAIALPRSQSLKAMKYLEDSRLLREADEAPAGSSMISSREEQRFKYERAASSEIERTLSSIENVLQARVHLNLPPRDPFLGRPLSPSEPGSASVLLVTSLPFAMPLDDIRSLVAGAAGIDVADVAVVISTAAVGAKGSAGLKTPPAPRGPAPKAVLWESAAALAILLLGAVWIAGLIRNRRVRHFAGIAGSPPDGGYGDAA